MIQVWRNSPYTYSYLQKASPRTPFSFLDTPLKTSYNRDRQKWAKSPIFEEENARKRLISALEEAESWTLFADVQLLSRLWVGDTIMMRKLSDYGLKELYDFKETKVPVTGSFTDFYEITAAAHDAILNYIAPAIVDLEALELINVFYFILHSSMDLRISSDHWEKNMEQIKGTLRKHGISDDLRNWGPMSPENYGGKIGVILCYNNLEFNSRLILALLDGERTDHITMKADPKRLGYNRLVCNQWVHYLYIQYGLVDEPQVQIEFNDSVGWLGEIIRRDPGKRDFVDELLTRMVSAINRFRDSLPGEQSK